MPASPFWGQFNPYAINPPLNQAPPWSPGSYLEWLRAGCPPFPFPQIAPPIMTALPELPYWLVPHKIPCPPDAVPGGRYRGYHGLGNGWAATVKYDHWLFDRECELAYRARWQRYLERIEWSKAHDREDPEAKGEAEKRGE